MAQTAARATINGRIDDLATYAQEAREQALATTLNAASLIEFAEDADREADELRQLLDGVPEFEDVRKYAVSDYGFTGIDGAADVCGCEKCR